jgi:hypothetical protein
MSANFVSFNDEVMRAMILVVRELLGLALVVSDEHDDRKRKVIVIARINLMNPIRILRDYIIEAVELFNNNLISDLNIRVRFFGRLRNIEISVDEVAQYWSRLLFNEQLRYERQMQRNKKNVIIVKLCINRIHSSEADRIRIENTPINSLSEGDFVFMVVDMMKNCGWYGLADRILEFVGGKKIN